MTIIWFQWNNEANDESFFEYSYGIRVWISLFVKLINFLSGYIWKSLLKRTYNIEIV
jgi:hypothetical protein